MYIDKRKITFPFVGPPTDQPKPKPIYIYIHSIYRNLVSSRL